jgi:hypothetical protein
MPEEGIRRTLESLGAGPKIEDVEPVIHLQRMFNVSYITALVRLRQANIITARMLDRLRVIPPVRTAEAMGYPPEWPQPPVTGAARYPLKFRSLIRDAYTRGVVGRSVIQQALKLDDAQVEEMIEAAPVISCDDTNQEWDEHAALGAVSA